MALSLGTLFVKLSADPSDLARGLKTAGVKVQEFGRSIKETSENLSRLGMMMAGIGIASTALASKFDKDVRAVTDDLSNSFSHIAIEVSQSMLPALNSINDVLTIVANSLRNIDSDTKETIATFGVMSAVVLVGAGAFTKIVSTVTSLAPLLTGTLAPALKLVAANFWPIALAIGAILLILPLLVKAISDVADKVKKLIPPMVVYAKILLDNVAKGMEQTNKVIKKSLDETFKEPLEGVLGLFFPVKPADAAKTGKETGEALTGGIEDSFGPLGDKLKAFMDGFVDYWKDGAKTMRDTFSDMFDDMFKSVDSKLKAKLKPLVPLDKKPEEKPKVEKAAIVMPALDIQADMKKIDAAKLMQAIGVGLERATQVFINSLGEAGSVINTFIEVTAATSNPLIGLGTALFEAVMKTESAARLQEKIGKLLGSIVKLFDKLFGWLFDLIGWVADAVSSAIDWVAGLFEGPKPFQYAQEDIGESLAMIFNQVYGVAVTAADMTEERIREAIDFFANMYNTNLEEFLRVVQTAFPELEGVPGFINHFLKTVFVSEIGVAKERLKKEEALNAVLGKTNTAVEDTADAFKELTSSLTNVPAGFRVALARFNATDPSRLEAAMLPGYGGRQPIEVNVYIDGKQLQKTVKLRNARDWYVKTGGTMPYVPGWVGDL